MLKLLTIVSNLHVIYQIMEERIVTNKLEMQNLVNKFQLMNDGNGNNFNNLFKYFYESNERKEIHHKVMVKEFNNTENLIRMSLEKLISKVDQVETKI
jgi:hypothetical protein